MKKSMKITIIVIAIIIVIVAIMWAMWRKETNVQTNLNINKVEDLTALVEQIYSGVSIDMPKVQTQQIEVTDKNMLKSFTGLDNSENLEYAVVSEPIMSSQAYSLVLVKVKDGANPNEIAKTMNENIDEKKWICVSAEKVYSAASGNIICLVMSTEEIATAVSDSFKKIAGSIGEENIRIEAEPELPEIPEDMNPIQE